MNVTTTAAGSDDQVAFAELLRPVLADAHRLAYAMLRSGHEADDAVQEAAMKAWRAFGRFRREGELRPWFLAIVANECRQRRRSRWWGVQRWSEVPDRPGREGAAPSAEALDMRRALTHLPHDMQVVIALRYYLDLPFEEIGRVLRCSPAAAKSRTHRALVRLRVEVPAEPGQ